MENKTPESSKTQLLNNILGCNDYYAKLFVNNLDENNLIFTEASFNGYKQILLNKDFWKDSIVESDKVVSYYNKSLIWKSKNSSYVYVYGYYIVDSDNTVIWYQKFPSAVKIAKNKGISVKIRVVLGCLRYTYGPTPTPTPTATSNVPRPTSTNPANNNPTPTPTNTSTP
jgi:hypothetical protein